MDFIPSVHRSPKVGSRKDFWWRGAVIYQIYPRSFADSNADGVGDLKGITAHLDHVASLHVDAIWISPFMKSPMKDYGYDVSDYCDVDPLFGDLADFKELLDKAHSLGLKVMIDFVPSHTSDQHAWFQESRQSKDNPKHDWYVWADPKPDGSPPNNWISVFGGSAWEFDTRRHQYYLHNFLKSQPDLNFNNPEVIDALMVQAKFWLELGVDGFRVDAIDFGVHDEELRDNPARPPTRNHLGSITPFDMQYQLRNKASPLLSELFLKPLFRLTEQYEGRALLGEISGETALHRMAEYSEGGGLDFAYSFDLLACDPTAEAIREVVERAYSHLDEGWVCWSFSNHDCKRSASRFKAETNDNLKLLIVAILTSLRGTICLYQGEELGLSEAELTYEQIRDPVGLEFWPESKGRDGCRTPMPWKSDQAYGGFSEVEPWLPIPEDHQRNAVDIQENDNQSVLNKVRQFLKWRRAMNLLQSGELRFVPAQDGVLAFVREDKKSGLLCLFNLSSRPVSHVSAFDLSASDNPVQSGNLYGKTITLPGYSMFFGKINKGVKG